MVKKGLKKNLIQQIFLNLFHEKVDLKWQPKTPCYTNLPQSIYYNLAAHFSEPTTFLIPTSITVFNTTVATMEYFTNFGSKPELRETVNELLAKWAPKEDEVWSKISLPNKKTVINQEQTTIKFFVEQLGITTLNSDGEDLTANFGGDFQITFARKNPNELWTVANTDIKVGKNKPDEWHIKLRTAAFNLVTFRDHLVYGHVTYSNFLSQAVLKLKVQDPNKSLLYKLLVPHVLGVTEVNSDVYRNSFNPRGILSGATGSVAGADVGAALEIMRKSWNPETFEEWKNNNKAFWGTNYVVRGEFFYDLLKEYVSGYFDDNKVTDDTFKDEKEFWAVIGLMLKSPGIPLTRANLEKWIVEIIWRVSYFHYQVGNILPFLYNCDLIRWNNGDSPSDAALWSLVVGFSTSRRQYQLVSFPYYCDNTFGIGKRWRALIRALEHYQDKFDNERIHGYPVWVWELEPSTAR